MTIPLKASDETALDQLNDHAQQVAADIHNDVDWAYKGTEKVGELPSMQEYADKLRIETGNERVDANSKEWLDQAVEQAKADPKEVEAAEDMANNFLDNVNQAYTKDMSWHQDETAGQTPTDNLFGKGLDDLDQESQIHK